MIPFIGRIFAGAPKRPGPQKRRAALLLGGLLLLAWGSLLSSCGGGPTVASSTGRTLYLSTTGGVYGFSIMSDGTLSATSSSPLVTASYSQIAATSGSQPTLIGANGTGSLTTYSVSGGALGSPSTLSLSGCSGMAATGVAVTTDNNYVLVVNGGATNSNIGSLALSGGSCVAKTTVTSAVYPVQPALDCSVANASYCILFLTLSSSATTTATTPVAPEEDSFTESTGAVAALSPAVAPLASCATSICPAGVAFNANTLYFYAAFNGGSPTLQSIPPQATQASQTTSFSTPNLDQPCIDSIGGTAYIPTSNGYVYSVTTQNGGTMGSPTTVLSPQSFGGTLKITSCAIAGS
ncbi:MAG: hypothetical protein ACP5OS_08810 [Leptospirillia bacterium]